MYLVKPNHFVKSLFYWARGNVKKKFGKLRQCYSLIHLFISVY